MPGVLSSGRLLRPIRAGSVLLLLALLAEPGGAAERAVDFTRDVRPILSNKCFACHGPDPDERKGGVDGLRLDTADGLQTDLGDGSRAVVPGDPSASRLIARIVSDDPDERMPPAKFGKPLTEAEIEILRQWIASGAAMAPHWAYVRPVRPSVPQLDKAAWPRNPIDVFLLQRLQSEGLTPTEPADRYALIRRVTLDLTGLPPSSADVDAFLADAAPDAYERLVDRLLASPACGEHLARMWLDLARYADSAGYADDPQRTIWAYRDWVIRAFNANLSFDQFTLQQLAGDLLSQPGDDLLTATAFHRNTLTNNEGGTDDEEFRNVAVVDRVNTTFAVWMGTTMACAQCHTHKYDPLTQEEYFRVFAILNNTADADKRDESPTISLYSDEQRRQQAEWKSEIAALERTLTTPTPRLLAAQLQWLESLSANVPWRTLPPVSAATHSGASLQIYDDGAIELESAGEQDVFTVTLPFPEATRLAGLQLEALPREGLPGQGPGFGGGNFVITRIAATLAPPASAAGPAARFVRIELPGQQRILSLAEVQAFRGDQNIALQGAAKQSSVAFDGPAQLAIDGNTSGEYDRKSTTHTVQSKDPWWELDLKSAGPIDRLVIWNRTDNNLHTRLAKFRVLLLDEQRQPVWQTDVTEAPNPSVELEVSGARPIVFIAAAADFTQDGFRPSDLLVDKSRDDKGWAIGGSTGAAHRLILTPPQPIEIPAGSQLIVTIEQLSKWPQHLLGRFRLSVTDDPRAVERGSLPPAILAILERPAESRSARDQQRLIEHYLAIAPALAPQRARLETLRQRVTDQKPLTTVPVLRELPADQRRTTRIQIRGNFLDTGAEVAPGVPAVFPPLPADRPADRLAFSQWLVSPDNPLTARVTVNRLWEKLFGIGLVRTVEEFGAQGELPSHPELLDWLAVEFMESGWDVKSLLRLLATSAAYRQSSRVSPELLARDPENRLLARGPRFRLPAEVVRDQALAAAGLLSDKLYGPPVRPPQPSLGLNAAFGSSTDWEPSMGEDRYRRGLYVQWRRSNPYPSMSAFDAPNREVCTLRRDRTNTPLQAFVTLNDPVFVEASQALGRRMASHSGSLDEKIAEGFRDCLSRPPSPDEVHRLVELYGQVRQHFAGRAPEAEKLATDPLGPLPTGGDPIEFAAWTVLGNVLLNLDETLMKR